MSPHSNQIFILNAARQYLRLIKAFNSDNFSRLNWRQNIQSILYALSTTMLVSLLPLNVILGSWYLVESDFNVDKVVVSLPLLFSLLLVEIAYLALIINNRDVSKTIDQIQQVINKRKASSFLFESIRKRKKFCWKPKQRQSFGIIASDCNDFTRIFARFWPSTEFYFSDFIMNFWYFRMFRVISVISNLHDGRETSFFIHHLFAEADRLDKLFIICINSNVAYFICHF